MTTPLLDGTPGPSLRPARGLLTAAPGIEGYYEILGMPRVPHAFRTDRER